MSDLQKYQWVTSGMIPTEGSQGAMYYYRGLETDQQLNHLQRALRRQIRMTHGNANLTEEELNRAVEYVMDLVK